ncbi:MFS transporter [Pectinatus brassicae]|uniref:MFS family permease n=1 Tax=Pectinatus brassicae TaxID=862415 RepID=A0A840UIL6_9FIRM|nr:MFS transporter [Pectinatus brassicae]MBB5335427.1 MFS family permease [Pectinatus brassicae]
MNKDSLFNKDFLLDTGINFVVYLIYYLLMVIIAVVAKQQLNASLSEAGLASGIFILGTLLARLQVGKGIELYGRKKTLYIGVFFYLVTTLMYFYIPNLGIMYVIRFLNGMAYGLLSTATNTIITSCIPEQRRGEGINYYGLSTSLAAAIGPFLGMLLMLVANFTVIIITCTVLIGLCVIGCLMLHVTEIKLTDAEIKRMKAFNLENYVEVRVLVISVIGFLMGFAYSSVLSFLAAYTREINLVQAGTFFFVVYAVIITITRPLTGIIFDRKGENYVLYPCYICLALGLFMLSITNTAVMLLLAGVFVGLGYGTFMSNGQAVCIKLTPSHRVSVALSTYFVALDLGLGVGPYILGCLRTLLTFQSLYLVAAAIAGICFILYFLFYGRKASAQVSLAMENDNN